MKKVCFKKLNILEIILIVSPIIDILTSITQRSFNIDISLGIIIRSFLLFFMTMYMLVKSNYKYKKFTIIYLGFVLLYFAIYIINIYLNKGNVYLIPESKELIKAFYFPICIITILNYIQTKNYTINSKILFIVMLEYILLLFIPSILNMGYESYAEDKIGTIGWFYSANEISAIYSILMVLIIYSYKNIKNIFAYLAISTCSLYTILQIGTKLPAITASISIISFIIITFLQFLITKEKKYLNNVSTGILVGFIFVFVFINSPVLKNFDIYKNYLINTRETHLVESNAVDENIQNNEANNAINIEEENELSKAENYANEAKEETYIHPIEEISKIESVEENQIAEETQISGEDKKLSNNEIATIIHSGRAETKELVKKTFDKLSIPQKMIGLGYINSNDNSYYLIEIDYYDILFNYGYLGFIIYFTPIITMLIIICRKVFSKKIKQLICNDSVSCFIIVIINGLLCAVAGHTFVAPAVSIYISIALIELYKELEC